MAISSRSLSGIPFLIVVCQFICHMICCFSKGAVSLKQIHGQIPRLCLLPLSLCSSLFTGYLHLASYIHVYGSGSISSTNSVRTKHHQALNNTRLPLEQRSVLWLFSSRPLAYQPLPVSSRFSSAPLSITKSVFWLTL